MTDLKHSPYLGRRRRSEAEVAAERCETCGGCGVVETDNNGPIGKCPACRGTGKRRAE